MFCRARVSGSNTYLQIVENQRDGKKVRQRVIATLGRLTAPFPDPSRAPGRDRGTTHNRLP